MQNVMENALKYGDGRRIELLFPEDDEGVLIAVKNGGCTLDRDEMPHIFGSPANSLSWYFPRINSVFTRSSFSR